MILFYSCIYQSLFFVGRPVESVFYFSLFFLCPHEVVSESSRLTFKAPRVIRCSLINWYMMVGQGRKVPLLVHTRVLHMRWVRDCIPNSVHHIRHGHLPIVPGNEPFCLKKLIQAVLSLRGSLTTRFSK